MDTTRRRQLMALAASQWRRRRAAALPCQTTGKVYAHKRPYKALQPVRCCTKPIQVFVRDAGVKERERLALRTGRWPASRCSPRSACITVDLMQHADMHCAHARVSGRMHTQRMRVRAGACSMQVWRLLTKRGRHTPRLATTGPRESMLTQ
jgi:translation initiation factor IF-1